MFTRIYEYITNFCFWLSLKLNEIYPNKYPETIELQDFRNLHSLHKLESCELEKGLEEIEIKEKQEIDDSFTFIDVTN